MKMQEGAAELSCVVLCYVMCCSELAQQVARVVRALSQAGLRVRSAVMTGGQRDEDRRNKTFRTQVCAYATCTGASLTERHSH